MTGDRPLYVPPRPARQFTFDPNQEYTSAEVEFLVEEIYRRQDLVETCAKLQNFVSGVQRMHGHFPYDDMHTQALEQFMIELEQGLFQITEPWRERS